MNNHDPIENETRLMGLRSAGLAGHWKDELAALKTGLATLEEQRKQFQPKIYPDLETKTPYIVVKLQR